MWLMSHSAKEKRQQKEQGEGFGQNFKIELRNIGGKGKGVGGVEGLHKIVQLGKLV